MKQKLLNSIRLRVCMLVAILCATFAGQAWGDTSTLTFTAACGGSGTANDGAVWAVTSDASESAFDSTRGIHYGTGSAAVSYLRLTTSDISGTITQITVNAAGASKTSAKLDVTVGGSAFGSQKSLTASAAEYTLTGSASGTIVVGLSQSKTTKALYVKSIVVTYSTGGGGSSTYTVTYDANGGTGTMTDEDSPYEEDDEVTLLPNTFTAPEGKIFSSWAVTDAEDNTVTVTDGKFTMPASDVTVTAQWVNDPDAPQYEWIETDIASLTASDIFVIVGNNGSNYAMTNNNGTSNPPAATSVAITGTKITSAVTANLRWNISGNSDDGYTFYPNGSTTTWLYTTNTNNGVRVGNNENKAFKISDNYLKNTGTSRYVGIYNSSDWRCYTSFDGNISNQTIKFYKRTALDNRDDAGISFANASQSAVIAAGESFKQTLANPNSLSVVYSSTNTDVATVASDGTVTLKAAGITTIKATFAGNESYKPAEVSYTLTVTAKYVATLVFDADAIEKNSTDAPFTNDIATDPDAIDVVYSSTDTDVATVNASTGEVSIVGGGTTTIKATIDDDDYEATEFTYTLTVNKVAAPISFSSASATTALDETESFVAPTLSNPQSLTIAYSSSNTSVATVDAGTGEITFNAVGNTTITATSTETAKYNSGEVSYTLTVTKAAEALPFSATFASSLGDFTVTEDATLGELWAINNSSAKASAYKNSKQNDGESWLISPYINITNAYATLSFDHADQYFNSESEMEAEATLWIRERDGDWEELTIANYPSYTGTTKSEFQSTSNSLSSYFGKKIQIGFKYLGNTSKAGSWFVKNFRVADDREEAPISFADATVYELLKNKDTYTGQALTNDEDLTVSYTSSNTDVATVDPSTGVVTIKAVGETNITATYAETASYKGNTATYKLVVTSKDAAGIEYAEDAVSKKITLGTYTHELTNPNDLTIAYTSSDETVATVNPSTGEVTMLKTGETIITATFTEDEDYDGATASYVLTVIKDDAVLSFAKSSVNAGLAEGTYTQAVTTTPADLPVTYSSSDETVGTVAADGTVTLLKKGSTTITANYAGNDLYNSASASYTLNVVVDYATLPFSYNSGKDDIGESLSAGTVGFMQSGLGSDYSATNAKLKFDGTGDYVILKYVGSANVLSYNITNNVFSGGTFKVQYSIDGSIYYDLKSYSSITSGSESIDNIPASARYIKWIYTNKSSGNVGLGNISLDECEPITIGGAGYTTHVTSHKVSLPDGVTAYIATATGASTVTLSTIEKVPASTAIILKADAGSYKLPVITTAADDASANILLASDGSVKGDEDGTIYALGVGKTGENEGKVGFYLVKEEVAVPAGKAYLTVPASVKEFLTFVFDDLPTTVSEVKNDGVNSEKSIFNLAGQKMSKLQKGVNIVNGKKVLVK